MLPLRRLSLFFALVVIVYALLVAPWHGLEGAYRRGFHAAGNWLFDDLGDGGAARFAPTEAQRGPIDTLVTLSKRVRPYAQAAVKMSTVQLGYRPTAFMIALAVATPITLWRRGLALVVGLVLVQAFVVLRVQLFFVELLSNDNALAVYSLPSWFKSVFSPATLVLFRTPAMHYIAPMFIWLAVTFRRGDFETLMGRAPAKTPAKPRRGGSKKR